MCPTGSSSHNQGHKRRLFVCADYAPTSQFSLPWRAALSCPALLQARRQPPATLSPNLALATAPCCRALDWHCATLARLPPFAYPQRSAPCRHPTCCWRPTSGSAPTCPTGTAEGGGTTSGWQCTMRRAAGSPPPSTTPPSSSPTGAGAQPAVCVRACVRPGRCVRGHRGSLHVEPRYCRSSVWNRSCLSVLLSPLLNSHATAHFSKNPPPWTAGFCFHLFVTAPLQPCGYSWQFGTSASK